MIERFIKSPTAFPFGDKTPWEVTSSLEDILYGIKSTLGDDFIIDGGVAIHRSATIAHNVTIKAPAIICGNCFVGANSYLRGGVFLARERRSVSVAR